MPDHDTYQGPQLWRGLLFAALIPLVLIGIALGLTYQYDSLLRSNEDVSRGYRQQLALAKLVSEIQDAETGQRGYVITGDPSFLDPYLIAREGVAHKVKVLDGLFKGETGMTLVRLDRVKTLIPRKFEEMQRVMDVRDRGGRDAAADVVSLGIGKNLMDDIRRDVASIEQEKNASLARKIGLAKEQARRGQHAYLVAVLLVAMIAFLTTYMVWKNRQISHAAMLGAIDASARQSAIFENTFNAIILINPSGSIEILNPAAERMFGYSAAELLRRDISVVADLAPGDGAFLDRLGRGPNGLTKPFRPHVEARRADGSLLPVEVALGVMPLEDGVHIVAVLSDVSEREKLEKIKDQFLSTVSHELRTPLTSIVGALGLLKGGVVEDLGDPAKRLVDIAENNAKRLIRIVNDLLDAEKLQAGQMTFAMMPRDLRDIVATAVDAMSGLAAVRKISLTFDRPGTPIVARGDGERLIQVIANLVSNAIKFSPPESEVRVSIGSDGHNARVAVADQGPGIDLELRGRLFTRFARAAGPSASTMPGTGLGLTISKDIVEQHGGSIAFADLPTGGTVFSVELPLWNALTGQADLNGAPRLLLYTDAAEAEKITAGFALRSIRADAVNSFADALAAIRQRRYLAMILDFQFADRDAIPLLQAVRAEQSGRRLPVIAIASERPVVDATDTATLDIIDWISKPVTALSIDDAIGAAIARAKVSMPLVLHVDDDSDTLAITAAALGGVAQVAQAIDVASARAFLAQNRVDILIVDIGLPDGSGLDIVADLAGTDRAGTPVIIYSAQDGEGVSHARDVEAILTKSKKSLPNLVDAVLSIVERQEEERRS